MHADHTAVDVAARLAALATAGGPIVSAMIRLAGVPKRHARRAALVAGILVVLGVSCAIEGVLNAHVALDALLGGPLAGWAAMLTYDGLRAARRRAGGSDDEHSPDP